MSQRLDIYFESDESVVGGPPLRFMELVRSDCSIRFTEMTAINMRDMANALLIEADAMDGIEGPSSAELLKLLEETLPRINAGEDDELVQQIEMVCGITDDDPGDEEDQ